MISEATGLWQLWLLYLSPQTQTIIRSGTRQSISRNNIKSYINKPVKVTLCKTTEPDRRQQKAASLPSLQPCLTAPMRTTATCTVYSGRQKSEAINAWPQFCQIVTNPCIRCHTTLWDINVIKQAISDKLQGSVATHLRCDGVVNNQIQKGLLLNLSVKKKLIGEYLVKLQTRRWLSRALCAPVHHASKRRRKCMRQPTRLRHSYGVPCIPCGCIGTDAGRRSRGFHTGWRAQRTTRREQIRSPASCCLSTTQYTHTVTRCSHFTAGSTTGWVNYANERSQAALERSSQNAYDVIRRLCGQ